MIHGKGFVSLYKLTKLHVSRCLVSYFGKLCYFQDGEFVWDKIVQGLILGSFFWGYLVTQIPGGWIATKFGGKKVYGISMLVACVATFVTPIAAQTSYIFLMVLRIILGICSVRAYI